MAKEDHQLIGKAILILSALLFFVVLIMTLLTMLSYSESDPFVGAENESDSPEKRSTGFRRPLLNENEHNLIRDDKNLTDFLATLNGLLIRESQSNVDQPNRKEFNSTYSPSNSSIFGGKLSGSFSESPPESLSKSPSDSLSLNLEQDWQKNSLNLSDALAQRLRRVQPEGDYVTVDGVPVDYEVVDSKNYQAPKRQAEESTYSDAGGYYDKYYGPYPNNGKDENTVEVYHDQSSADYPDGGQVQYYLIRKEHNQINLASQHEVRGLNELINRALAKQNYQPVKYPPVHVNIPAPYQPKSPPPHQPNIFVFPSNSQPATIIQPSNIVQQQPSQYPATKNHHYYLPHQENFWGWGWSHYPLKKLTLKQKVQINVCQRMMKKVYPVKMPWPIYR